MHVVNELGSVGERPFLDGTYWHLQQRATTGSRQPRGVVTTRPRATAPTRPHAATRPIDANRSPQSQSRARPADASKPNRYRAQTGSPTAPADQKVVSAPDSAHAAPASATTARP